MKESKTFGFRTFSNSHFGIPATAPVFRAIARIEANLTKPVGNMLDGYREIKEMFNSDLNNYEYYVHVVRDKERNPVGYTISTIRYSESEDDDSKRETYMQIESFRLLPELKARNIEWIFMTDIIQIARIKSAARIVAIDLLENAKLFKDHNFVQIPSAHPVEGLVTFQKKLRYSKKRHRTR